MENKMNNPYIERMQSGEPFESVYEDAKIIYRKDNFNYICFNKSIDPVTKEVVCNV